ncbi:hypothetical protein Tco_0663862 [Tanacetum coccineum]
MSQPANDDFSQHLSDDVASYHEDASDNGTVTNKPKQQQQQLIHTITTISNIKLLILKKEGYDIWAMEMEHYLEYIDNDVWKLEAHGAEVSTEDANHKFLRSLPPAWSNLAMTVRTKPDVDTLSIDDLYNNLRVFEQELTSTSKSSASAQNVAFVSHSKSSNNKIDDVDIEEMDINWQIAMIVIRMKKFYKKTERRVRIDGNKPVRNAHPRGQMMERRETRFYQNCLLTMDDGVVNWGEHTVEEEETNHALMAISSNNEVSLCSKTCIDSYNKLKTLCDEQMNQLGEQEAKILAYTLAVKKLEAQVVTFQKQQLSQNEQLTFQTNEIYAKDEKLKKYRRIGMKAIKEKEQLQKIVDSWKNSSKNL